MLHKELKAIGYIMRCVGKDPTLISVANLIMIGATIYVVTAILDALSDCDVERFRE